MTQQELEEMLPPLKAAFKEAVDEKSRELSNRLLAVEQRVAEGKGGGGPAYLGGGGLASAALAKAIKGDRIGQVREGVPTSGRVPLEGVSIKALIQGAAGDSPATIPSEATRGTVVAEPMRPLTLLELLPRQPIATNLFEFVRITSVGDAGQQPGEGAEKPEVEEVPDLIQAPVATFAATTRVSKQCLADSAQLQARIGALFAHKVVAKFEAAIVAGGGTGPTDQVTGLIESATVFAPTSGTPIDALSEAAAALEALGFIASLVVLHPTTWHDIRTAKAETSGTFLAGNFTAPAPLLAWGARVVASPSVPVGEAIVLDPRAVLIIDREQPTVMVSTEDRDNFVRNLVTILAELRGTFAVLQPDGVLHMELPTNSP